MTGFSNIEDYRRYLQEAKNNPRVQAALAVIRNVETSNDPSAYNTNYGGSKFTDLSQHPRRFVDKSDAAGAYQFLSTTWDEQAKKLGLKDFSPESQDIAAIDYMRQKLLPHGGLAGLKDQLTNSQFAALGTAWAGLPFSPYGQTTTPNDKLSARLNKLYGEKLKEFQTAGNSVSDSSNTTQASTETTAPATPTSPTITENDDGTQTVSVPGGVTVNLKINNGEEKKKSLVDTLRDTFLASVLKGAGGSNLTALATQKLYPDIDEVLS